jgi:acyl-CoA thioester hydrolase
VVYYGRYLGLLERARTEFLEDNGVNVAAFHAQGSFFVVTHVDIHYRRPARLGDVVTITSEVIETKKVSMTIKNRVLRDGTLLVEADVTIACVDQSGRPQRLPGAFHVLTGQ